MMQGSSNQIEGSLPYLISVVRKMAQLLWLVIQTLGSRIIQRWKRGMGLAGGCVLPTTTNTWESGNYLDKRSDIIVFEPQEDKSVCVSYKTNIK